MLGLQARFEPQETTCTQPQLSPPNPLKKIDNLEMYWRRLLGLKALGAMRKWQSTTRNIFFGAKKSLFNKNELCISCKQGISLKTPTVWKIKPEKLKIMKSYNRILHLIVPENISRTQSGILNEFEDTLLLKFYLQKRFFSHNRSYMKNHLFLFIRIN